MACFADGTRAGRRLAWLLAGLLCLTLPGCSGCRQRLAFLRPGGTAAEEQDPSKPRVEPEEPEKPFDFGKLLAMPYEPSQTDQQGLAFQRVKPGHWTTFTREVRANEGDFRGDMAVQVFNAAGKPIRLEHTPFVLETRRLALLPKKQRKFLDLNIFIPGYAPTAALSHQLFAEGGSRGLVLAERDPVMFMKPYEFHFVVLTSEPESYRHLSLRDFAAPPTGEIVVSEEEMNTALDAIEDPQQAAALSTSMGLEGSDVYYRVSIPRLDPSLPLPLPANPLTWTNIAYVLWDDAHPDSLSESQRQALLDWIHWGGQLIVSGPGTLENLRGSIFEPYLPALPGETWEINSAALQGMNDEWTLPETTPEGTERWRPIRLEEAHPWPGVELQPYEEYTNDDILVRAPGAVVQPLVIERAVGRGRIVATAFRLRERKLINWPHFDGFFNACLLRRPPREYRLVQQEIQLDWAGDNRYRRFDPRLNSRVRFFSRDILNRPYFGLTEEEIKQFQEVARKEEIQQQTSPYGYGMPADPETSVVAETHEKMASNELATWNDFSLPNDSARSILREAAGIEIPRASFVAWVLAAYLLVLVPFNFAIFRTLGRLEWAWVAVPILAIIAAASVVKLARLDIGFASSRTELSVVELQAGYPRAHVTRYSALYTSLSTSYGISFDDPHALAQPFSVSSAYEMELGQEPDVVRFTSDARAQLSGVSVPSNATGMVRAEHFLPVGGVLELEQRSGLPRLNNGTDWDLANAAVLRTTEQDRLEIAWIGELAAGGSAGLKFQPLEGNQTLYDLWQSEKPSYAPEPEQKMSLGRLVQLAQEMRGFRAGEYRLVAQRLGSDPLPGMRLDPEPPQAWYSTLVVANLARADEPPPQPDLNAKSSFIHQRANVLRDPLSR